MTGQAEGGENKHTDVYGAPTGWLPRKTHPEILDRKLCLYERMGLEMFDKNIVCLRRQADDKSSVPVLLHLQVEKDQ
jgi:hypothetical protein